MSLIYQFFIDLFRLLLPPISLFSSKIRQFYLGRKNWRSKLKEQTKDLKDPIWIHCSSLGEFEQGRSVIEELKKRKQNVVLSFFSPSGYEQMKHYELADVVCYLPIDSRRNARSFLNIVDPKAILFVKYEFWFNFIRESKKQQIPMFLISGIFREEHYFFKAYGRWFLKQLKSFRHFFVQNDASQKLLQRHGITNVSVGGDTRFDRVIQIKNNAQSIEHIEKFRADSKLIVAGSTWAKDEELLSTFMKQSQSNIKLIVAPHEVDDGHIQELRERFSSCVLYSEMNSDFRDSKVLVINRIGLLSKLYQYADLAYIGGGFGKGIHNTLEAAVYGIPILFGPNYNKFNEAKQMISKNSALSIHNQAELNQAFGNILKHSDVAERMGKTNADYVGEMSGSTQKIIQYLDQIGLLTN